MMPRFVDRFVQFFLGDWGNWNWKVRHFVGSAKVKLYDCLKLPYQFTAILVLLADSFDKLHTFELWSQVRLIKKAFLELASILSDLIHEPTAFPDFSLSVSFAIIEHVVDDLVQGHYLFLVALLLTVAEQASIGCIVVDHVFFVFFFVREERMRFLYLASYVLPHYLTFYSWLYNIFLWICLIFLVTIYFHLLHLLCFLHFLHVVLKDSVSLREDIILLFLLLHVFFLCPYNLFQIIDFFHQIVNLESLLLDNTLLICHFLLIEIDLQLFCGNLGCKIIVFVDKLLYYIEIAIFIVLLCLHHHVKVGFHVQYFLFQLVVA